MAETTTAARETSFARPKTQAGKEMQGESYIAEAPLLTNGASNPRLPPGHDIYSVLDEERATLGIAPHEEVAWVRNPVDWRKAEMQDRVRQWTREQGGRRIPLDAQGEPVTLGDLVLVVKQKSEAEEADALQVNNAEDFIEMTQHGDVEGIPRYRAGNAQDLEERAQRLHEEHVAQGLIGPTSGMDFERVIAQKGIPAMLREQAFYRNGGRHVDVQTEAQGERMDAARGKGQAQRNFSDSGFPRNPKSALAQAQNRNK